MMLISHTVKKFFLVRLALIAAGVASSVSHAQTRSQVYGGPLDRMTPTAFAGADVGYNTFDSQLAGSNASGQAIRYLIGAYAGESRNLGMILKSSQVSQAFALTHSDAKASWKDASIQGRLGWFYPSVILSFAELKVNRDGVNIVDMYGTGIGLGGGVRVPFVNRMVFMADAAFVKPLSAYDKTGKKVALSNRLEMEAGSSFAVLKDILDLNVGYHHRSYSVLVKDGQAAAERNSAPYLGLRLGTFF